MTIIAGFWTQEGVLICSDTQYTGGTKIYKQKIFPGEITGDSYVFALAGHEGNATMAIDECKNAIADLKPEQRTAKTVKKALQKAIKPICDDYVLARPQNLWDELSFELLIACWIPRGGGHNLFSVGRLGDVNRQDGGECKGTGAYIGQYVMGSVFKPILNFESVKVLAANVLSAAKSYDPNCGGPSTFVVLDKTGKFGIIPYDYLHAEQFLTTYEAQTRSLLFHLGNPEVENEVFEKRLLEFTETMKSIRAIWKSLSDAQKKARQSLPEQSD